MRIEDEHVDVLQNLESAVAHLYRSHPELTDYPVQCAYDALAKAYAAEAKGREPKPHEDDGLELELLRHLKPVCEWRLGRGGPDTEDAFPECDAIDVPTLVLCLQRLVKSVKKWNKYGGRRGYLDFMTRYVN
jgi:hypothetical protein